jgi:hypothetical protein
MIAAATADRQSQFSKRATAGAQATQSALPATGAIDPVANFAQRKLRPPGSGPAAPIASPALARARENNLVNAGNPVANFAQKKIASARQRRSRRLPSRARERTIWSMQESARPSEDHRQWASHRGDDALVGLYPDQVATPHARRLP